MGALLGESKCLAALGAARGGLGTAVASMILMNLVQCGMCGFALRRILAAERHTCLLITHDVEEAIHLADRIVVLSPRPAMIQATFDVPFPHPRNVASAELVALKAAILREFGL